LGELPPKSINGVSISNKINLSILSKYFHIILITEFSDIKSHKKLTLKKIISQFSFYSIFLISAIKNKFNYTYLVLSCSTIGALKTLFSLIIIKITNYKCIIYIHIHRGDYITFYKKNILNIFINNLIFNISNHAIVLSNNDKFFLQNKFRNLKVNVLENTIDFEVPPIKTKINKDIVKFVYISNYLEEKGIYFLLDNLKNVDFKYQLNCYGDYSDSEFYNKLIKLSTNSNIFLNKPIYGLEKMNVLKNSDCLILPSFNEGKPLIILEAMSIGLPFISSDVGFIKEMVYDNYPFFFTKKNKNDFIKCVNNFFKTTEDEIISIRCNLVKYYINNYSNTKHENNLIKIFNIC
jgi:glycosyltransferase involved in cell wall biosynthesis